MPSDPIQLKITFKCIMNLLIYPSLNINKKIFKNLKNPIMSMFPQNLGDLKFISFKSVVSPMML